MAAGQHASVAIHALATVTNRHKQVAQHIRLM